MMHLIGIDAAKFKHTVSVIDLNGEMCVEPFDFDNDAVGFSRLLDAIRPFISSDHRIGIEDTGHYADNLRTFLLDHDCTVAMFNPASTNHYRLALNIAKNDHLDSVTIANALMNPKMFRIVRKSTYDMKTIRQYTRIHHKRTEELSSCKAQLQKDLDLVFPEYNTLFGNKYGDAYLNVLKLFPSAYTIAHTDIRSLRKALKHEGKGRQVSLTAEQLKQAARDSVGQYDAAIELDITQLIQLIEQYTSILDTVDKKIEEFSKQLNSPILGIPGISHFSAMSIISELGDISRFPDPKKIIKYAGVNPYVYDSGTYSMTRTRLEKKGSVYLRKTLYQIIDSVIQNNPVFNAYYQKKIAQGKSYRCAQGHCVRKLLRLIYHILTTNEPFCADQLH